jgi:1-acyl-sn-glycerol-3-phosphate acyltransferase
VQPVALKYFDTNSGQHSPAPCYVGDETLMVSVWRTLRTSGITVQIIFGEVQSANGRDRRAWAAALRIQVEQMRLLPMAS